MERWRDKEPMGRKVSLPSLVPRPTCAFHCSAAVGLVYFPRAWCEGEFLHGQGQLQFSDNEGRQRIILLVTTLRSPFVPQTKR